MNPKFQVDDLIQFKSSMNDIKKRYPGVYRVKAIVHLSRYLILDGIITSKGTTPVFPYEWLEIVYEA